MNKIHMNKTQMLNFKNLKKKRFCCKIFYRSMTTGKQIAKAMSDKVTNLSNYQYEEIKLKRSFSENDLIRPKHLNDTNLCKDTDTLKSLYSLENENHESSHLDDDNKNGITVGLNNIKQFFENESLSDNHNYKLTFFNKFTDGKIISEYNQNKENQDTIKQFINKVISEENVENVLGSSSSYTLAKSLFGFCNENHPEIITTYIDFLNNPFSDHYLKIGNFHFYLFCGLGDGVTFNQFKMNILSNLANSPISSLFENIQNKQLELLSESDDIKQTALAKNSEIKNNFVKAVDDQINENNKFYFLSNKLLNCYDYFLQNPKKTILFGTLATTGIGTTFLWFYDPSLLKTGLTALKMTKFLPDSFFIKETNVSSTNQKITTQKNSDIILPVSNELILPKDLSTQSKLFLRKTDYFYLALRRLIIELLTSKK